MVYITEDCRVSYSLLTSIVSCRTIGRHCKYLFAHSCNYCSGARILLLIGEAFDLITGYPFDDLCSVNFRTEDVFVEVMTTFRREVKNGTLVNGEFEIIDNPVDQAARLAEVVSGITEDSEADFDFDFNKAVAT